MMLLLWLFAVSSGIVNACVLEPRGTDAYFAGVQPSTHATPTVAGHAEALIKLTAFFDLADRGPALPDSMLWAAAIQVVSAHRHMDSSAPATSEPPVRVRYPRLAL